ncbi:MAG: Eco57I restriction-modification methylase domain-containing protein, partial [Promethearchaeota archaeon]
KILDPSCGSGRFLILVAELLLKIIKLLRPELKEFDIKKNIIQNNLYGVDIDNYACMITKMRLIKWLYGDSNKFLQAKILNLKKLNVIKDLDKFLEELNVKLNVLNKDFLLEYKINKENVFDIIIGNPPYIENKKIKDLKYKKRIYKKYESAYKLFDLSIIFIEKSIELCKENCGYISFITTNKFLSADYGIKIRDIILKKTKIIEIYDVSSFQIFKNIASYPIIISLKKNGKENKKNKFIIKNYDIKENIRKNAPKLKYLTYDIITQIPGKSIPISGNIELISYLYSNYLPLSSVFKDIKIYYRPYGFLKWEKHFKNISKEKSSDKDLILLGTGNVGKYHIKFNERIKIAKQNLEISYFKFNPEFEKSWSEINSQKLIFREIAKNLTFVYDPGIFTNITGLYFLKIPSLNKNNLYSLLTIFNSKLMDTVFKTLFSSLHMSKNYLRFNGSFIKRLPITRKLPFILGLLGNILQFLSQFLYNIDSIKKSKYKDQVKELNIKRIFFTKLTDSLVYLLFLKDFLKIKGNQYRELEKLLEVEKNFYLPSINEIKYDSYISECYFLKKEYVEKTLNEISKFFNQIIQNKELIKEIDSFLNIKAIK